MDQIIDLENFERKDSVLFFQTFADPYVAVTSEVECTGARNKAKELGISFFLYYAHAMLKASNEIKEFRYRMYNEKQVILYDTIHILTIIRTGENGSYNTVFLEYDDDLLTFARNARKVIDTHVTISNCFGDEKISLQKNKLNVFLISALPTLSFTGVKFAHRAQLEGYPLSLIGKLISREGKEYIPIAINVNHAFIDGYHIDRYFSRVSELLTDNTG